MNCYKGDDGKSRCGWCSATEQYQHYHDSEWGYPVDTDIRLFEKICLEGFQAGLSWRTVLEKRENFRAAFAGFDFHQVALFDESNIEALLQNAGIIRHRGKIEATINNAQKAIAMQAEYGSLAAFFWQYESVGDALNLPAQTQVSVQLSKELRKKGWKFVGPTTAYSFMQAMGLVNDHSPDCDFKAKVDAARAAFNKPSLAHK